MAPIPTTNCTGCQLEGKTRCGACFKSTGEIVRYCGPECQKTMWKVHRYYCGKPPALFFQPPLEKYEYIHSLFLSAMRDLKPGRALVPNREQIRAAGSYKIFRTTPLATQSWEKYQIYLKTQPNYRVQNEISGSRVSITSYCLSPEGQLDMEVKTKYQYIAYGLVPRMAHEFYLDELPEWRVITSDFNYSFLNYAVVQLEIQAMNPGDSRLILSDGGGPRARALWARAKEEARRVDATGGSRFMVEFHEQDRERDFIGQYMNFDRMAEDMRKKFPMK